VALRAGLRHTLMAGRGPGMRTLTIAEYYVRGIAIRTLAI
jgi:hypothetical protein